MPINTRIFPTALLFLALCAQAEETRYISDPQAPLRSSPCDSCTVVHAGLQTGTQVTLHHTENGWAYVTSSEGVNGWLPSRHLEAKPVTAAEENIAQATSPEIYGLKQPSPPVATPEEAAPNIAEEKSDGKGTETPAKASYAELEQQHAELSQKNAELESELLNIKKVSENALALQEQNEELIKENRILQSEMDVLTANRDQMYRDNSQKWFLYGGIAVFLGALLAVLLPALRPRRRYSEWK